MNRSIRSFSAPVRQQGAVLYVALIMLILLALIGIAGMQVAGMQEKMAASYRATNTAFQNAEGVARRTESALEAITNRTSLASDAPIQADAVQLNCDDGYDPVAWGRGKEITGKDAVNVRQIDTCIIGGASLAMGKPLDKAAPIYQITSFSTDLQSGPSSSAVIDTVFKP
ncbi:MULTISPECIES: PilX N-terminal domain-containing pilus assembly protein [Stenotrophomonas]|jgi:type IV pilus assembly protein PilX|uniref:PilX N-terminal domain-containing pilus assembly protein n=1 Tax=Stenotrophomonas TaxID=40323 RepID=UPI0018D3F360|nr:PilX N-terminal domain-containing pilus assembly protein [Stenotrophomonas sp.]MBH1508666.1 pilus assembly protein [Stenotrophomonas maltophilia]